MSVQRSPVTITTRSAARRQAAGRPSSDDEGEETFVGARSMPDPPSDRQAAPHLQDSSLDHRAESALIRDGIARFATCFLRPDGSNYRVWLRELTETAFSYLRDEHFYVSDRRGHPLERAARSILLGSVDSSIRFDLYDFARSDSMLAAIKGRFGTINRATQLSRWRDLFHISVSADVNASEISSSFRSCFDDLLASGIPFSRDAVLGLILQSAIPHGTDLRNEFDQRMDMELSWNNNTVPRFDRVIDLLSASQTRLNVRARDRQREVAPTGLAAAGQMDRSPSIESHPDNVYGLAGRPDRRLESRPRTCFRCGSTRHQIADCTEPPKQTRHQAGTMAHGSAHQFQAFYPIVTPPVGYVASPPVRPPAAPAGPALRPADSYRPSYGRGPARPTARQADVEELAAADNDVPDGGDHPMTTPEARNADFEPPSTPPEVLFDTGATHHLTGDNGYPLFSWSEFNANRA